MSAPRISQIFSDDVSGQVIGDMAGQACRLCYEGRPQGPQFYAKSDAEAKEVAAAMIDEFKNECADAYRWIYPNTNGWELRIYD